MVSTNAVLTSPTFEVVEPYDTNEEPYGFSVTMVAPGAPVDYGIDVLEGLEEDEAYFLRKAITYYLREFPNATLPKTWDPTAGQSRVVYEEAHLVDDEEDLKDLPF